MENFTGKHTIKSIFKDRWSDYVQQCTDPIPDYVYENVTKILECRDTELSGYHKFVCPNHPDNCVIIPHSCKSRFCNSCGKVATDNWIINACNDFPNTSYFHITFTIPSELRPLFASNHKVRSKMFSIASSVILDWAKNLSSNNAFIPAITCVLHTFGRDLKFHPHIHMLVSSGGLDVLTQSKWVECSFLPQGMISKRWQTKLLYYIYSNKFISKRLKKLLFRIKWYIHICNDLFNPVLTTNYIGRYTKKPPLSEARIIHYDGQYVTFVYTDWADFKMTKTKTIPVFDFISLLIQHIPPKHFKLIRHFGLLNNRKRKEFVSTVTKLFGTIKNIIKKTTWRMRQIFFKGQDPLICKICKSEMILIEKAFKSRDGGLFRMRA